MSITLRPLAHTAYARRAASRGRRLTDAELARRWQYNAYANGVSGVGWMHRSPRLTALATPEVPGM